MPYIDTESKAYVKSRGPTSAGELNYAITKLILKYLGEDFNYQKINDIVGALEGAKSEFTRRVVGPYEDKKIKENGDVYPVIEKDVNDLTSEELREMYKKFGGW